MNLTIDGVGKRYRGDVLALDDFSLELRPGVLGLLGPNGAGKSTLMRILSTISPPTRGCVRWNDVDIRKKPNSLRSVLGYLPQDFGVYPNLTAVEFLQYVAAAKGIRPRESRNRIDRLLALVNLTDVRSQPLGGYSGGMRQRVGIAQALLNDPEVLIVDEPTAGLDPEERVRFRNLLAELSGERIVILSTHIVSDVAASATNLAIILDGRLLRETSPEALLQSVDGRVWSWMVASEELTATRRNHLISGMIRRPDGIELRIVCDARPGADASPLQPTLEDAYLAAITSKRAERP
jgi:ABC-type multidrug transport system ATPase subunit